MDEAQIVMEHQKAPFDLPLPTWKPCFVDEIEHSHATLLLLSYKSSILNFRPNSPPHPIKKKKKKKLVYESI